MDSKLMLAGLSALTGGALESIIENMERKYEGVGKQKREQSKEVQEEKIRKAEEKRLRKLKRKRGTSA